MAAFEGLIDASIDHKVIIPGTGLCNLPEKIAISAMLSDSIVQLLTLPLFYSKDLGDDGYFEYFERLVDA